MGDQQIQGAVNEVKRKVEEAAGKMTGNEEQELHGQAKQVQGQAQKTVGNAQENVQDAIDKATR
jgi:uncharacterized protein YjbJ (UPF0337 family)